MPSANDREPALPPTTLAPVLVADLFHGLQEELVSLLSGLGAADWDRPTAAGAWTVRDVAAHLLDVDLRRLSISRDGHLLTPPAPVDGYRGLVGYLDRLNAAWVAAARRISPTLLVQLLRFSGERVARHVESLDPFEPARLGVAWAGQETSPNWLDIGREYTERWHHQDQIREAIGAPGLTAARWLGPVVDISMRALPHAYRDVAADVGDTVVVDVAGEAGGVWCLLRDDAGWALSRDPATAPRCRLTIDAEAAARLLLHRLPPLKGREAVRIDGDHRLAEPFLAARAVMVLTRAAGRSEHSRR